MTTRWRRAQPASSGQPMAVPATSSGRTAAPPVAPVTSPGDGDGSSVPLTPRSLVLTQPRRNCGEGERAAVDLLSGDVHPAPGTGGIADLELSGRRTPTEAPPTQSRLPPNPRTTNLPPLPWTVR